MGNESDCFRPAVPRRDLYGRFGWPGWFAPPLLVLLLFTYPRAPSSLCWRYLVSTGGAGEPQVLGADAFLRSEDGAHHQLMAANIAKKLGWIYKAVTNS